MKTSLLPLGITLLFMVLVVIIYILWRGQTKTSSTMQNFILSSILEEHCENTKKSIKVTEYSNTQGEVGGYFAEANIRITPNDLIPGWSGTLYGATGSVLAMDGSIRENSDNMIKKRDELKKNFPLMRETFCGR